MTDVSVLTPSFRYDRFIAHAIESVIRQQGLDLQHIIHDGGLDDESVDVLRSFGDRVEGISERDLGQSDALNKALTRATGDWVASLNADEYYLPNGIRVLVDGGERHGANGVYGDWVTVDHSERILALRPQHPFSHTILRLYGPFLASVSVIIRRSMLWKEPWDRSLRVVMDWDSYLALASRGASSRHVAYPVRAFRQHEDHASAKLGRPETRAVRECYGIPTGSAYRRAGVALHRIRKLVAGSYGRPLRGKSLAGLDLGWFREETGADTFRLLLDRCYGVQPGRAGNRWQRAQ